ncbi:zeta toxin family protein [Flavobacterium sp. j3]|uniref:Zeta toxin family protein n=1 Tax=Flavobacterium aureirubrum TaxID=3133147 RepID=A0ABU9N592_9FLAO
MGIKRMRVFAGPNGSGKTTIIKSLQDIIPFGVYINADDIELQLKESKIVLFNSFQLNISQEQLQDFFKKSTFSPIKRKEPALWSKIVVEKNILKINAEVDSYLAADIAEFIRQQLLASQISFSYETVMSHPSKIDFLKYARSQGFKVYLYYIATEDPEINISRVNVRVAQNGHPVKPETVIDRYYKSLGQLREAIRNSDDAYFWDNSGSASSLIADIKEGSKVTIVDVEKVPNWFLNYVVNHS